MFKILTIVSILLLSTASFAEEQPRHQVIFGNNMTTGWSGGAARAKVDSGLGIDKYDLGNGNFSLNYAYRFAPQFQIGVDISNELDTYELKAENGNKVKSEKMNSSFAIFGIVNFTEEIKDSFYLGLALGVGNNNETVKTRASGTTTKDKTKSDSKFYSIYFGKRFNLKFAGIENLTYSPSISYEYNKVGGDLEDEGIESLSGVTLDLIKFDLLF